MNSLISINLHIKIELEVGLLFFGDGGKREKLGEKPMVLGQGPKTNSTRLWRWV